MEELSSINAEEFKKRCDLERSLREAASIFKRELYEKEEALAAAHAELRLVRDWQERAASASQQQQRESYQVPPCTLPLCQNDPVEPYKPSSLPPALLLTQAGCVN